MKNKSRGDTPEQRRAANSAYGRRWREKNPQRAKAFVREATLKQRYGITEARYQVLLAAQGGVCAVCKSSPAKRALDVDHCHETGLVRGLLCRSCNIALGMLRECPHRIQALKDYIGSFNWIK